MRKGFAPILIIFVALVSALIIGIGIFLYKSKLSPQAQTANNSKPTPTSSLVIKPTTKPIEQTSLKTYKNEKIGFQIDYPSKYSKSLYVDKTTQLFADFNGVDEIRGVDFDNGLKLSFQNKTAHVSLNIEINKGKPGPEVTLEGIADVSLGFIDKEATSKVKKEKVVIDGLEGLQTKLDGSTLNSFFLYKDYLINIYMFPIEDELSPLAAPFISTPSPLIKPFFDEIEYQKIISSLKFSK